MHWERGTEIGREYKRGAESMQANRKQEKIVILAVGRGGGGVK
jgi:hypothetical protein